MARIDEHEVFARFIGEKVNAPLLEKIARNNGNGYGSYADSTEHIIAHVDYYDVKEFQDIFGLTPTLTDRWDYKGIDFSIYLYVRDEIITGGHIFKYKETSSGGHFRPSGYEMEPTQQEIRIAKRILEYITNKQR